MTKRSTFGKACVLSGAAIAMVFGLFAATAEARRPCYCPDVWMPVICSNGYIYSNFCYAGCAGATGCVLYGGETE